MKGNRIETNFLQLRHRHQLIKESQRSREIGLLMETDFLLSNLKTPPIFNLTNLLTGIVEMEVLWLLSHQSISDQKRLKSSQSLTRAARIK